MTSLLSQGDAYRCYCSPEELASERSRQIAAGLPARYGGRCARLSDLERATLSGQGRRPVIRFRVTPGVIAFDDLVRGHVEIDTDAIGGDFVIARADGSPLYHLSVVVDDADMEISHVIRGEDHLSNTPKHILLFQALGVEPPIFAHLPLILNSDRSKMSKRDLGGLPDNAEGDVPLMSAVVDYLAAGFIPEALLNYLALLGWSTGSTDEILDLPDLIERFDLARVNKAGAVFNLERLAWLNGQWIRRLSPSDLSARLLGFLADDLAAGRIDVMPTIRQMAVLAPIVASRLVTLRDITALAGFLFRHMVEPTSAQLIPEGWTAAMSIEALRGSLETLIDLQFNLGFGAPGIEPALKDLAALHGWKNGPFFGVLRAAISAQTVTPPLTGCLVVLGEADAFARIEHAIEVLEGVIEASQA